MNSHPQRRKFVAKVLRFTKNEVEDQIPQKKQIVRRKSIVETPRLKRGAFLEHADEIWKDRVRREKFTNKLWNWKWDFLVSPSNKIENSSKFPEIYLDKAMATRRHYIQEGRPTQTSSNLESAGNKTKPSAFMTSAREIGKCTEEGRTHMRSNAGKLNVNPTLVVHGGMPKISLGHEQYGVYRKNKYLKDAMEQKPTMMENPIPSKLIRHQVNPLLC